MRMERDTEQVVAAIDHYIAALQRAASAAEGRRASIESEQEKLARALEIFVDRRIDRALGR